MDKRPSGPSAARSNGGGPRDKELFTGEQRWQVRHRRIAGKHNGGAHCANRCPRTAGAADCRERGFDCGTCKSRAVLKMNVGAEPELPAVIVVFRFPARGQRRPRRAAFIESREPVEYQLPGEAGLLGAARSPGIALGFNNQRAAIMRAGARHSGQREHDEKTASYKGP